MARSSKCSGFTLIELLFVVAVIGLLAAIALPGLSRARNAANESSAIASLRAINSGQQVFMATCGAGAFAPSLQNLAQRVAGAPGFISTDLGVPAPIVKSGFEFDLGGVPAVGTSCNGGALLASFHVTADPLPSRGHRYFGTNGSYVLYQSTGTLFGTMPDLGRAPAPAVAVSQ